ncbi:hypothetical protein [Mesorhizobium sp. Z1-4]|uniref:hypothetical protein n=1 Tax=Mesorhizobium sp. Z1-4 TaxID=2448478 RepID=UPI000FDA4C0E|nr:hypothetical protein [Mesorhizobium sp. Z1-4]
MKARLLLFSMLWFLASLSLSSACARADELVYKNSRFGTEMWIPTELFTTIGATPFNGDGITLENGNGAELRIFGSHLVLADNAQEMLAIHVEWREEDGDTVTYARAGRDWFVISGLEGGSIFYERHEIVDQIVHSATLLYPKEDKHNFAALVETLADRLGVVGSVSQP